VDITVPESIRRIADSDDRRLAWEFFVFFSRFEYALKRTPRYLAGGSSGAQPNWDRFGSDHDSSFRAAANESSTAAIEYFRRQPPRKQVKDASRLAWSEPQSFAGGPELVWLLLAVRTVRNNLFHGGKFPLVRITDPSRDAQLLQCAIAILSLCLRLDDEVRRHFEEPLE
jgi:hypothetical protein